MRIIIFFTMFFSLPAFSYNIQNYPFEEFRDSLCKRRLCLDRGPNHVQVSGIDTSVLFTRGDFDLIKTKLVAAGINPESKDVLALSPIDYAELEYNISAFGDSVCEAGKVICAFSLMVEGLPWGWRAASLACVGTMPKCQKHYQDNMKRLEELIKDLKENERIKKEKEAEVIAGGGGGPVGPDSEGPGAPSFGGGLGFDLDCRMLPAYTITAEGTTWHYEAEEVCKPRGGW